MRTNREHETFRRRAVAGGDGTVAVVRRRRGGRLLRPVRFVFGRGRRGTADGAGRAAVLRARRPAERERRPVQAGSAVVRERGEPDVVRD